MTLPDPAKLYDVIDATWPAASKQRVGPWVICDGQSGGSRVSAARLAGECAAGDLHTAERAMAALGQPALFMIRAGETDLDQILAGQGYRVKDPVTMYAARAADIATTRPPPVTCFTVWPPLRAQAEIWAAGGIGAGRLAVMDRAAHPKATLLGRCGDRPAGTLYVGISQDCAMIHALEVSPADRRKGLARHLTRAAAFWAISNSATYLTLVTTDANPASNALYASLGFAVVGHYHYRIKEAA